MIYKINNRYTMNKLCVAVKRFRNSWILANTNKRLNSYSQSSPSVQNKEIPRPRGLPFVGTKLELFASGGGSRLHEYIHKRHGQLGPIFSENLGGAVDLVFISDPDMMKALFLKLEGKHPLHILPEPWLIYNELYNCKRGLFFMDGQEWYDHRRILNKYLLKEGVDKWLKAPICEVVNDYVDGLKERAAPTSCTPDLESDFYRLSIKVIVSVLLGAKGQIKEGRFHEDLIDLFAGSVKRIFMTTTKLYAMPAKTYAKYNLPAWKEFKQSVDDSLYLGEKLAKELSHANLDRGLIYFMKKENISDENIIRIAIDFIMAAGDTTSFTLLWIMYLLCKNDRAFQEIRKGDDTKVKFAIKEAMRLYPVAPFLTRILPQDSLLNNYHLKAGTPVIASIYTSGHMDDYFSKANQFLPYRWDRNDHRKPELPNHVTSASVPFAFGARSCIGKKIALIQLSEVTKMIVKNFDLNLLNSEDVNAITCQVLVPKSPIKIQLTPLSQFNNNG